LNRRTFMMSATAAVAGVSTKYVSAAPQKIGSNGFPVRISSMDGSIGHRADIRAFETAWKTGLDGIQLQYDPYLENPNSLRHKKTMIAFRDVALQWNVQVNALCIGALGKTPLKSEPAGVSWVIEALQCANFLGASVILLPILGAGHLQSEEEFKRLIAVLKELGPRAEDHGVVLGLECWISGKDQVRVVEEVNSPGVRIYYDFHNAAYRGHDPLAETPLVGPYLCEVHVKNMNGRTGKFGMRDLGSFKTPTPAGRTRGLDHLALAVALKKTGYTGWLTLENGIVGKDKIAAISDDVKYVREVYG
jgi:L-ribulose-5-phosphate 3-epimerase